MLFKQGLVTTAASQLSLQFVRVDAVCTVAMGANKMRFHLRLFIKYHLFYFEAKGKFSRAAPLSQVLAAEAQASMALAVCMRVSSTRKSKNTRVRCGMNLRLGSAADRHAQASCYPSFMLRMDSATRSRLMQGSIGASSSGSVQTHPWLMEELKY